MDLSAYFAGFVDGEGCFTVSFSPRSKLLTGWEALLSSKQRDFERFAKVCRLVQAGAHRNRSGLREIVDLALAMNASGKRKFGAEAILVTGAEVIVSATSNGGVERSSDPHEWRNDLSAVSTRGSAKLNWP